MNKTRSSKKRKETPIPRVRRIRLILGDLAFDVSTEQSDLQFGVSRENRQMDFTIRFDPPLEKESGATSYLQVTHLPSKRRDCEIVVLPNTTDKRIRKLENWCFLVFPSHSVKLSDDGRLVECLYLSLVDEQLRGDCEIPILRPVFRYYTVFGERYHPLEYYPPIDLSGIAIDATKFPQGHPLTFKGKDTGIQSSSFGKFLGYYPDGDNDFNSYRLANMRFGVISEPMLVAVYLDHFKDCHFYQAGYYSNGVVAAQPDGLIDEDGLFEAKSSRSNCTFEGSHIAQIIGAMAACDRKWCDLTKFCEKRVKNDRNEWTTAYTWRCVRIFRSRELEKLILELVKAGPPVPESSTQADYQLARRKLDEIAQTANTTESTELPVPPEVLERMHSYRRAYFAEHAKNIDYIHPIMDVIEKRQARIFAAHYDGADMTAEIHDQIHDYLNLLNNNSNK